MVIHCLGINHETAALELREKLAFTEDGVRHALALLGDESGAISPGIGEMVILSTCNRIELYAVLPEADFPILEQFLTQSRGVPAGEFASTVYRYLDKEAVAHLLRVAAGLDSQVLGEPQILGQVMRALELARGQNTAGPVLSRLFQTALHTGKRARTETAISQNPASISSVAVHLAGQTVGDLNESTVGIVGAGEMAELAVEAIRKRSQARVRVVNRTLHGAQRLANRWGGQAATFDALPELLTQVDILITSTGAPHTVIHRELVSAILPAREGRPLVIIDIAMPRDVDIDVGSLPGVRLFDIDTLHEHLEYSLARRAGEVPQVESILAEEAQIFMDYLRTLNVIPLIAEMSRQAEQIRLLELEKSLRRLPDLTQEEQERLDALTRALVSKLLHAPITTLRQEAGGPQAARYAAAVRDLFGLQTDSGS